MDTNFFIAGEKRNAPLKLEYNIYGNGKEKIIFLNGILSTSSMYKNQIKYLIDNYPQYQIACFHYRGIGNSQFYPSSSIRDHSNDVNDLLNHLNWDSAHIISTSFGSQVAFDFALHSPQRVKSLLLSSMKPPYRHYIAECSVMLESLFKKDIETFQKLFFSSDFLNSKDIDNKTMKSKIIDGLSKQLVQRSSIPKEVIMDQFKSTFNFKITDEDKLVLNEREFPISILYGTNDALFPFKDTLNLFDLIKPENFTIVNGCGHGIPNERIKDFNQEMNKCLNLKRNTEISEISIYKNVFDYKKKHDVIDSLSLKVQKHQTLSNQSNFNNIIKTAVDPSNSIHNNKLNLGLKFLKTFKTYK